MEQGKGGKEKKILKEDTENKVRKRNEKRKVWIL